MIGRMMLGRSGMVLLQSPVSKNPADLSDGYYFLSLFLDCTYLQDILYDPT